MFSFRPRVLFDVFEEGVMDQETHDAAVRTVAKVFDAMTRATGIRWPGALSDDLLAALSPPAKPEAKLEALPLPTRADWNLVWLSSAAIGLSDEAYSRVAVALHDLSKGDLKIVDERGKGAEAERLAPCPVCGRRPKWHRTGCTGMHICEHDDTAVDVDFGEVRTRAGMTEAESAKKWNAAFQRAERFPGER